MKFEFWKFEFVSDWSETDASPDIRILDLATEQIQPCLDRSIGGKKWEECP
jgi:hypothetical protein